jgi:hypothetical protein
MQKLDVIKYSLFHLTLLCTLLLIHSIIVSKAFAVSPTFSQQVMTDNHTDWIDWSKKHPFEKDSSTDITRVTYFSDGKTLNATLRCYAKS